MTAAQFTVDRLYTKDLYVNGAQIAHPDLAALLTDHPSNNVGIGTNDPKVKLDINGTNALRLPAGNKTSDRPSVADSDYCIRYNTDDNIFEGYSNGNWGSLGGVTSINQKVTITADNTAGLQFYTDDGGDPGKTERMTILNDGYVGIGESSPKTKLHISNGHINIEGDANSGDSPKGVFFKNGGVARTFYISGESGGANTSVRHLYLGYSDTLPENFSDSTFTSGAKMVIRGDGNVGIGTTSPSNTLTINGSNDDTVPILGLRSGNINSVFNDGAQIAFGYNGFAEYQHFIHTRHNASDSNNAIDFYVCDGTSNNTVTSGSIHTMSLVSGNVGIGTTSPGAKLDISGGHLTIGNYKYSDLSSNGVIQLYSKDDDALNNANCLIGQIPTMEKMEKVESITWQNIYFTGGTLIAETGKLTRIGTSTNWTTAAESKQEVTLSDKEYYDYVDFSFKKIDDAISVMFGFLPNDWDFDSGSYSYQHIKYNSYITNNNYKWYYYPTENSSSNTNGELFTDASITDIFTFRLHFGHSPFNTNNDDRVQILRNGVVVYTFTQAISTSDYPINFGVCLNSGEGIKDVIVERVRFSRVNLIKYSKDKQLFISNAYNFSVTNNTVHSGKHGYDALENITSQVTGGDSALYIDSNKNVGIGTTSPGAKLDISGGHLLISDVSENSAVIELSINDENKTDCIIGASKNVSDFYAVTNNISEDVTFTNAVGMNHSAGSVTKTASSGSWSNSSIVSTQQVTLADRDLYDYVDFSYRRKEINDSKHVGLLINGRAFDSGVTNSGQVKYRHLKYQVNNYYNGRLISYYYQIEGNNYAQTSNMDQTDNDINTIITLRIHFAHSPLNTYNEDRVQILINGELFYTFDGTVASNAGGGTMDALSILDYPIKLGITILDYNNGINSIKMRKAKLDRIPYNVINLGIDFEDVYIGAITNGTTSTNSTYVFPATWDNRAWSGLIYPPNDNFNYFEITCTRDRGSVPFGSGGVATYFGILIKGRHGQGGTIGNGDIAMPYSMYMSGHSNNVTFRSDTTLGDGANVTRHTISGNPPDDTVYGLRIYRDGTVQALMDNVVKHTYSLILTPESYPLRIGTWIYKPTTTSGVSYNNLSLTVVQSHYTSPLSGWELSTSNLTFNNTSITKPTGASWSSSYASTAYNSDIYGVEFSPSGSSFGIMIGLRTSTQGTQLTGDGYHGINYAMYVKSSHEIQFWASGNGDGSDNGRWITTDGRPQTQSGGRNPNVNDIFQVRINKETNKVEGYINNYLAFTFTRTVVESDYPFAITTSIYDGGITNIKELKRYSYSTRNYNEQLLMYNSGNINLISNRYNFNIKTIQDTTNRGSAALQDIGTQVVNSDSALYIDSNKNVGIGTTTPDTPLHIDGGAGNFAQILKVSGSGSCWLELEASSDGSPEEWGICSATDGNLDFYKRKGAVSANNGYKMILTGDGKLGIGTESPFAKFTIGFRDGVSFNDTTNLHTSGITAGKCYIGVGKLEYLLSHKKLIGFGYVPASTNYYPAYIGYQEINTSAGTYGDLIFGTRSDTSSATEPSERMRIDRNGRVGIGVDDPGSPFHVKATTSYEGILLSDENSQIAKIARGSSAGEPYINLYTNSSPTSGSSLKVQIQGAGKSYFNGGNIGIGVTSPDHPLHVGNGNNSASVSMYMWDSTRNRKYYSSTYLSTSIKAHHFIWSQGFFHSSDERIKKNIIDVPDNLSLEMVRNIPCRYYEYKDYIKRGQDKTIGFIAQEVKEVMPMAVGFQTDYIPNELRKLTDISWNNTTLYTDLSNCSGIKYRFYVSNDPSDNYIKEVVGNADDSFTFDQSYNNVFCYGKEVDDFHTVDKDKLFSLNFSATQEIDRIQQAEKAKLAAAETKLAAAETEITTLKDKVTSLETNIADLVARLTALETA